ncbi:MAG: TlpA disulfide reductase family protein [Lysobacteraceae bacterium]
MNTRTILIVAVLAAVLGAIAGLMVSGPGPLWRSRFGQQVLQDAMGAKAPPPPAGVVVAKRGEPMPPLLLPDLAGRAVAVPEAWAGRPLLINVWASWCGPCIEELPELQRFSAKQGAKGVQVVGIALDGPEAVRNFLTRVPVQYPILIEPPGPADASVRLGNPNGVLPYSVLIGADGRLLRQRIGPFVAGELDAFAADATR